MGSNTESGVRELRRGSRLFDGICAIVADSPRKVGEPTVVRSCPMSSTNGYRHRVPL